MTKTVNPSIVSLRCFSVAFRGSLSCVLGRSRICLVPSPVSYATSVFSRPWIVEGSFGVFCWDMRKLGFVSCSNSGGGAQGLSQDKNPLVPVSALCPTFISQILIVTFMGLLSFLG